jgi:hypothetical protein
LPIIKTLASNYIFIKECVEQTGEYAIYHIGQTGGYFVSPELSTDMGTAIYFNQGENLMPSKQEVENELSAYMDGMLDICLDYGQFSDFQITSSNKTTRTVIEDNRVIFEVEMPVTIVKADKTYEFESFNSEVLVRLGIIHNSIREFIHDQLSHKESVCATCIIEIADKNDLHFRMLDYDETTVLFNVRDKNSKILNEEYEFKFANRY